MSSPDSPTPDRPTTPSSQSTLPPTLDVGTYIEDGARIAAILGVWGIIAAFFTFGVGNVGGPGSLLHPFGAALGGLFSLVGLLNALLFLIYRGIDYWQA